MLIYNMSVAKYLLITYCLIIVCGSIALCSQISDNNLKLSFSLYGGNEISSKEPLIGIISMNNLSRDDLHVDIANEMGSSLHMVIYNSKDQIVAESLQDKSNGFKVLNVIKPSETKNIYWIISGLYSFKQAGKYKICVNYDNTSAEPIYLNVTEYNMQHIEEQCEAIFRPIRDNLPFGELPFRVRIKSLLSVEDDCVLPYLDWMARNWSDRYSCRAMRLINSKRSVAVLNELELRNDKVGQAARESLKMTLVKTMWDVLAE